jgi:hypothetical protein
MRLSQRWWEAVAEVLPSGALVIVMREVFTGEVVTLTRAHAGGGRVSRDSENSARRWAEFMAKQWGGGLDRFVFWARR